MHLTCSFLASGTVCNSSLWPYLSPGMPRNSVQLPTNLPLPALTDCLHSRAAERRCLAHQERAEAVVRLWQADRMSKSKLLVRHCSSCFALATLQTSTVCTNMLASSGSPTGTVIQLDPTGSHWESQCVMEQEMNLECVGEEKNTHQLQFSKKEPKIPAWFSGSAFPALKHVFGISVQSPTSECACFFWPVQTWATGCMRSRSYAFTAQYNQPDCIEVWHLGCTYSVSWKYLCEVQHKEQFFWGMMDSVLWCYARCKFRRIKNVSIPKFCCLLNLARNEKHDLIMISNLPKVNLHFGRSCSNAQLVGQLILRYWEWGWLWNCTSATSHPLSHVLWLAPRPLLPLVIAVYTAGANVSPDLCSFQ